ncbi:MFS transporter [Plantactinospora sp. ZYX-F-223]|uniref:MFS transporter n=1 Tax=Plantactinospora sp. ZYX-F-223 TaxID=3144103 RepID=UPI0031FBFBBC
METKSRTALTDAPERTSVFTTELWILTTCQFLYYGGLAVDLTLTAVVGLHLAPSTALATVPLTVMTVVATVASYLAGTLSVRLGHRTVLLCGAATAVVGGLICMWATITESFLALCLGTAVVGLYKATGGYFRYLAADRAPTGGRARALSIVLCGGLAAAFLGPWGATASSGLLAAEFAGSYLLVSLLAAAVVLLVLWVRPSGAPAGTAAGKPAVPAVPIRVAASTRDFRMAFLLLGTASVVMTMLMAMGPIGSSHAGHALSAGALMIQWHMVGMFGPSLFSGAITTRWGAHWTGLLGAGILAVGGVVGSLGTGVVEFTISLALIGVGWNFLYVAGSTYVVRCYPQGAGGRVQGAVEASVGSMGALASLSAAAVFASVGWQGANLVAAGLSVLVVAVLTVTVLRSRQQLTGVEA